MTGLVIIFTILCIWMVYNIGKNELERQENLKELENKFLITMAYADTYKFQMLSVLKIVYEKAGETDEQFVKDYEKISKELDRKVTLFADQWIKNMNETLGHKTEYQNWGEATRYIEKLLKANKNETERSEGN